MKDYTELKKEDVLKTVAEGTIVYAIVLSLQNSITKSPGYIGKGIYDLGTDRSVQNINDIIKNENAVFYVRKEDNETEK